MKFLKGGWPSKHKIKKFICTKLSKSDCATKMLCQAHHCNSLSAPNKAAKQRMQLSNTTRQSTSQRMEGVCKRPLTALSKSCKQAVTLRFAEEYVLIVSRPTVLNGSSDQME